MEHVDTRPEPIAPFISAMLRHLRLPVLTALVFLFPWHSAAAPPPCAGEDVIHSLQLDSGDWLTACFTPTRGTAVLAAARRIDTTLEIVAAASRNGGAAQPTRLVVDDPEIQAVLPGPDDLSPLELRISSQRLRGPGVRISITSRTGEDLAVAQEIAVLFQLRPGGLEHLWTGLGSRTENRFDACLYVGIARFTLLDAAHLKRTVRTTRTRGDSDVSPDSITCEKIPATSKIFLVRP